MLNGKRCERGSRELRCLGRWTTEGLRFFPFQGHEVVRPTRGSVFGPLAGACEAGHFAKKIKRLKAQVKAQVKTK